MNYPIEKYKFYTNGKKVIAVSTYAGKPVRGIATCSSDDTFNLEKGKRLAAARCNEKIALKRLKCATDKRENARIALAKTQTNYTKMLDYSNDALDEWHTAYMAVEEILEEL